MPKVNSSLVPIQDWEIIHGRYDYEPKRSKLGQERLGKNNLQDFMGILNGSRSKGKNLFKMERR